MLKPTKSTERRQRGRPPISKGARVVRFSVSLNQEDKLAFIRLGGSRWLRKQIKDSE